MPSASPLEPGDRLVLKKGHPCGANDWEIVRLGMDVKLRCVNCGRYVTLPRSRLERRVRQRLPLHPPPQE
jgi:hypothetical protein